MKFLRLRPLGLFVLVAWLSLLRVKGAHGGSVLSYGSVVGSYASPTCQFCVEISWNNLDLVVGAPDAQNATTTGWTSDKVARIVAVRFNFTQVPANVVFDGFEVEVLLGSWGTVTDSLASLGEDTGYFYPKGENKKKNSTTPWPRPSPSLQSVKYGGPNDQWGLSTQYLTSPVLTSFAFGLQANIESGSIAELDSVSLTIFYSFPTTGTIESTGTTGQQIGAIVTVGVPMPQCNVSLFNGTAFAEELAAAYSPELFIDPADVIIIEARCVGDVLEVSFAFRQTTTAGSMPLPPSALGSGNGTATFSGTTWSIISWPGYTSSSSSSFETTSTRLFVVDSSGAANPNNTWWLGLAGASLFVICMSVAVIVYLHRRLASRRRQVAELHEPNPMPMHDDSQYERLSSLRSPQSMYDDSQHELSDAPAYTAEKMIGSGQFGSVYLARSTNGQVVALKELNVDGMSASDLSEMKREAQLLEKCQHEFVVAFYGVVDRQNVASMPTCPDLSNGVFMVMALCEFGDLGSAIQKNQTGDGIRYDPVSVMLMAKQAAQGMAFLHSQQVVHRDIALRNFLVSSCCMPDGTPPPLTMVDGSPCRVLISDFGLGRMLGDEYAAYYSQNEGQLPVRWMAPEAVLKGRYGRESDVYAFGVAICELVNGGQQPFKNYANSRTCQYDDD